MARQDYTYSQMVAMIVFAERALCYATATVDKTLPIVHLKFDAQALEDFDQAWQAARAALGLYEEPHHSASRWRRAGYERATQDLEGKPLDCELSDFNWLQATRAQLAPGRPDDFLAGYNKKVAETNRAVTRCKDHNEE